MKNVFGILLVLVLWGCGATDSAETELPVNDSETVMEEDDFEMNDLLEELEKGDVLRVTEFFDYACVHCRQMQGALAALKQDLGDQIEIESKPLIVYEQSRGAALAAECARDQDLWDGFHQSLFALQGKLNEQTIPALVHDLGLDKELFSACIASGTKKKVLEQYQAEADSHGVSGTPSFLINGESVITGAYPPKVFEAMIKNMASKQ